MTSIDIEQLPALVAEGRLSRQEAVDIIWEDMYTHAGKYGIGFLSEDEKSEFLMYAQEKFYHIFDDFEAEKAQFRTYLRGLLKNRYLNWIRKVINNATEELIIKQLMRSQPPELQVTLPEDISEEEIPDILQKEYAGRKKRSIAESTALVLTLKSCHHIDEKILENVSKFIHVEKETLRAMVNKLKHQSDYKAARRAQIIRRRDNAFYYHRRYMIELSKLEKGTTSFEKVMHKYQMQTESWIRQNKLLSHRFVLSPSNVHIAEEIGMEPRKVSFYINHALRTRNPFSTDEKEKKEQEDSDEES